MKFDKSLGNDLSIYSTELGAEFIVRAQQWSITQPILVHISRFEFQAAQNRYV